MNEVIQCDNHYTTALIWNTSFALNTTAFLGERCFIEIPFNEETSRSKGFGFATAPNHIFLKLQKLKGIEFHRNKFFIKESTSGKRQNLVRTEITNTSDFQNFVHKLKNKYTKVSYTNWKTNTPVKLGLFPGNNSYVWNSKFIPGNSKFYGENQEVSIIGLE